jgi:hypothetical protein
MVWVTTAGYSGNAAIDACDVVITVDPQFATAHETMQYNIEAKKRRGEGGKRVSSVFGGGKTDESGIDELQRFVDATPSWADPIVVIKFDRREAVVFDAQSLLVYLEVRDGIIPKEITTLFTDVLQPRVTPSGNVSMVKPPLSEWNSESAGKDHAVKTAQQLGLPLVDDD